MIGRFLPIQDSEFCLMYTTRVQNQLYFRFNKNLEFWKERFLGLFQFGSRLSDFKISLRFQVSFLSRMISKKNHSRSFIHSGMISKKIIPVPFLSETERVPFTFFLFPRQNFY